MLTSSESVSNLSDTESMKKNQRELRLGDRVLVRSTVFEHSNSFRLEHQMVTKSYVTNDVDSDRFRGQTAGLTADEVKVLTEVKNKQVIQFKLGISSRK